MSRGVPRLSEVARVCRVVSAISAAVLWVGAGAAQVSEADGSVSLAGARERGVHTRAAPRAELSLHGGAFRRSFRYRDDVVRRLQAYTLRAAPWVQAGAALHPASWFIEEPGALGWLRVEGSYGRALGLESERFEGERFETSSGAYHAALGAQVPIAEHRASFSLGYGARWFELSDTDANSPIHSAAPGVPSADYRFLRLGVGFEQRAPLGLSWEGRLGYRLPVSSGEIASDAWFPNASSGGVDAQVALRLQLGAGLDARLAVDFERYFFTLDPEVGAPRVAGGALDQYLGVGLGLGYTL